MSRLRRRVPPMARYPAWGRRDRSFLGAPGRRDRLLRVPAGCGVQDRGKPSQVLLEERARHRVGALLRTDDLAVPPHQSGGDRQVGIHVPREADTTRCRPRSRWAICSYSASRRSGCGGGAIAYGFSGCPSSRRQGPIAGSSPGGRRVSPLRRDIPMRRALDDVDPGGDAPAGGRHDHLSDAVGSPRRVAIDNPARPRSRVGWRMPAVRGADADTGGHSASKA